MKNLPLLIISFLFSTHITAQQSVILQPDASNGKDAWIWSFPQASSINFGAPNIQNNGLYNVIRSETWQWTQGQFDTIRGLIAFDFDTLPQGAIIDSAKLDLYFYANPSFTPHSGTNESRIHPITQDWDEATVNWQNQPEYDPSLFSTLPTSSTSNQNYTGIDVTNLVISQIQNQQHGWLIKLQNESGFNGLTFASSDHTNANLRPRLTVYYSNTNSTRTIVSEENEPSIYPNPGSHQFNLQGVLPMTSSISIECYNALGELQEISLDIQDKKVRFTLNKHNPGIYYLKVRNKREVRILRFLKL